MFKASHVIAFFGRASFPGWSRESPISPVIAVILEKHAWNQLPERPPNRCSGLSCNWFNKISNKLLVISFKPSNTALNLLYILLQSNNTSLISSFNLFIPNANKI